VADQGDEGLLSPYLRRRRIAAARPHLNGRILDVGCGSGALAEIIPAADYLGVDMDEASLAKARSQHPGHRFQVALPPVGEVFDTVVCLAVIEHVSEPVTFLRDLAARLAPSRACIVLTTPHPAVDWIHTAGASLGLFSRHASEEHEDLLGRSSLVSLASACGLQLVRYEHFLLGANQLAIFQRGAW
jgi:2-polyprenyl-3-methyl-5-hydroxy-6-metoxy-1,4-benzoquinol methylase